MVALGRTRVWMMMSGRCQENKRRRRDQLRLCRSHGYSEREKSQVMESKGGEFLSSQAARATKLGASALGPKSAKTGTCPLGSGSGAHFRGLS